jgi:hypothetical protein
MRIAVQGTGIDLDLSLQKWRRGERQFPFWMNAIVSGVKGCRAKLGNKEDTLYRSV